MIKIKFDGTQIDGNAFAKITKSGKVYDKNFKLGSTICETYKINVNKDYINTIPSVVEIEGKNICPTDFSEWESGQYSTSGQKQSMGNRVRAIELKEVQPSTTYYSNTFSSNDQLVIREYDSTKTFVKSTGAIANGRTFTTNSSTKYISYTLWSNTNQTRNYNIYKSMFENGTIKPLICLNSEVDKSFEKYTYKTLYVTNCDDNNDFVYTLETEDAMTKFNFKYDASPIMTHTKTVGEETINFAYLSEILDDICTKAGITNGISSFYGDDIEVSWYNNTYMARDYISYIGEINAKNLCISDSNSLIFKDINGTAVDTISIENIGSYKLGIEHSITRVVWDNGINKWEYGTDAGETYYINVDNVYVLDEATVEHIYNEINGLVYYNFKTDNCILNTLNCGDLIQVSDSTNNYKTFIQFSNAYFSGDNWFGGIELNLDSLIKQETQVVGEQDRVKEIRQTVDRLNNQVEIVVREAGEIEEQVTELQTSTYTKTEIQRIVDGTGVDGVKVSAVESISGTFDIDGMHYAKTGAETTTTINQNGVQVDSTTFDEELLFAGYDTELRGTVVRTDNLKIKKYLAIGDNSRVQDYGNGGGVFVI